MVWSKPFDDVELEYIRNHAATMSCEDIARKLGRSKSGVANVVNRLGLRSPRAPACAREGDAGGEGGRAVAGGVAERQDELAELREIKRALKRSMREECGPRELPKVSAELREVIKRITELEEGDGDADSGAVVGGSINLSIPLRPA